MTDLSAEAARTWTPEVSYLNDTNGEPLMRPAKGGMWVSIADYNAQRAEIARLRTAAEDMRELAAVAAHEAIVGYGFNPVLMDVGIRVSNAIRALLVDGGE